MAQTRNAIIKLKDAIKDLETITSQDPEMYYTTRWPGIYIAENFADIPGHTSIVVKRPDALEHTTGFSYLQSRIRIHCVLLVEAVLSDGIEILYKPADGPGVRTQLSSFTERDQDLMDDVASRESTQRQELQGLDDAKEGTKPSSRATGSEASGDAANAEDSIEPTGTHRATFLCCRQDAGKYEYLIVDDTKVYHSRWPRFRGGPKEPHWPLKLNEHCEWAQHPRTYYLS
ncbi:hypothetical protein J4E86_010983 [Alternaria arbusti]|uniref:uncharacterized protein n=1 Tax=Alternaria arbusti TaxID=232088 RepID=UPI00221EBB1F|nr:uncharacterized protein J4E86_010983 [Alternaria arbusti]KAI4940349.1 hypothetical protein J4E86_010983 [Alternaria arbusti]